MASWDSLSGNQRAAVGSSAASASSASGAEPAPAKLPKPSKPQAAPHGDSADARAQEDAALLKHKDELKKEYLKVLEQFQDEKLKVESELKTQVAAMADSIVQKVLAGK